MLFRRYGWASSTFGSGVGADGEGGSDDDEEGGLREQLHSGENRSTVPCAPCCSGVTAGPRRRSDLAWARMAKVEVTTTRRADCGSNFIAAITVARYPARHAVQALRLVLVDVRIWRGRGWRRWK